MDNPKFSFIVSNGPKLVEDPALRKLIRKQAMRDVGIARKKRGGSWRAPQSTRSRDSSAALDECGHSSDSSNVCGGSSATSSCQSASPASNTGTIETEKSDERQLVLAGNPANWLADETCLAPVVGRNPWTAYEQLRSKYCFDVRDLSVLTSFNVGKNTLLAISTRPEALNTLFGSQLQSYLHHIPGRYGHKRFLTAAVDCVIAKAHSTLNAPNSRSDAAVMRLYAQALAAVQEAIAIDPDGSDPDLLCAVQMLSLHEMLDSRRPDAYLHHINGAALITQRRTPARFRSDYEKMLFHAHLGPMFTEALFHQKPCYLESPEWMELYESLIEDTPCLTDRSAIIVRLRIRVLGLASLLPETTKVMILPYHDEFRASMIENKTRQIHQELLQYLEEYKSHVMRMSMSHLPDSELALRREVFGTALECLCVYKRILATFCESERLKLESEVQELARQIFDLQNQPAPRHSWIYSTHEKGVAASVQLTREAWERDLGDATIDEQRLAARIRWKEFNNYLHGP